MLAFFYFRFIDTAASVPPIGGGEIAFFVVALGTLVAVGNAISTWWIRPLVTALATGEGRERPDIRRRALLQPWMIAGVTAVGWVLAGLTWGVAWPLATGTFDPRAAPAATSTATSRSPRSRRSA